MNNTAETIGFIGVGLMGHGIAKNLLIAGYPVYLLAHRNRAPIDDLLSKGAREVKPLWPIWRAILPSYIYARPAHRKSKPSWPGSCPSYVPVV